jgi:hypothetical protein
MNRFDSRDERRASSLQVMGSWSSILGGGGGTSAWSHQLDRVVM